ncbi:hypothetical protein WG66_014942 [Moniliophthora roreri]|nr:hypothetical protein WG66_014942 [Moniliophthora roreri]
MRFSVIVSLLAFFSLSSAAPQDEHKKGQEVGHSSHEWLNTINRHRKHAKVDPLTWDDGLAAQALEQSKSCDTKLSGPYPNMLSFGRMKTSKEAIDLMISECYEADDCKASLSSPAYKTLGCDQTLCPSKEIGLFVFCILG